MFMEGVEMQKATLIRASKSIVAVFVVNGVFYAFYRIAGVHLQLPPSVFAIGCVILGLLVLAICRKVLDGRTKGGTRGDSAVSD